MTVLLLAKQSVAQPKAVFERSNLLRQALTLVKLIAHPLLLFPTQASVR
jgi:hypothetical protein